jgi:hypothetical protein
MNTMFSSGGGPIAACFVLLLFSGLLRPWRRSAPGTVKIRGLDKPLPNNSPGRVVASPISLSSIELALIAELSRERARDFDAVAGDADQRPEARQAASEAAIAWRERARMLQLEAGRRSGQPMLPEWPAEVAASTYTGPERRRRARRAETRRGGPDASSDASGSRDRRTGPERRRRDRRRARLAPY